MKRDIRSIAFIGLASIGIVGLMKSASSEELINGRTVKVHANVLNLLAFQNTATNQSVYVPVGNSIPEFGGRSLQELFNSNQAIMFTVDSYYNNGNNNAVRLSALLEQDGGQTGADLNVPLVTGAQYRILFNNNPSGYVISATEGNSFGIAPTTPINPTISKQVLSIPEATQLTTMQFLVNGVAVGSVNTQLIADMVALLNGGVELVFTAQLAPSSLDYTLSVSSPSADSNWPSGSSYAVIAKYPGASECSVVIPGVNGGQGIVLPVSNGITTSIQITSPIQQKTLQGSTLSEHTIRIGRSRSIARIKSLTIQGAALNSYELKPMSEQNGEYVPNPSAEIATAFEPFLVGQRFELRVTFFGNLKLVLPNGTQVPVLGKEDMNAVGYPATISINNQPCATITNVFRDDSNVGPLVVAFER